MGSKKVQAELYVELGVYRSKVEGKRTIARKTALLAVAAAEKVDPVFLHERMVDIDAAHSSDIDLWSSTLALIPGKIGAIGSVLGKSATLYENMESMVAGKRGETSAAAENWEASLRSDLELLHKKADDDPAFALLVDQYLGDKLGPVNASADETLGMFPPFRDSKILEDLSGLVKQDQASYQVIEQNIKKLQDELEVTRLQTEADKKIVISYEERMQEVAEYRIYCRLAVRVLQELNPNYAKAVSGILQAVMDAQEISVKLDYKKLTASAAAASYFLIAMSVLDAFQDQQDPNQLINERLSEIVKLIVDLSQNLIARLENLQTSVDLILKISTLNLQQAIENHELLIELHKKANEIHEQIFAQGMAEYEQLQAGFNRPLVDAFEQAFSHKKTHRPGAYMMDRAQFDSSLSQFLTAAQVHSADSLALPSDDESLEEIHLQEGLFKRPLAANLPYFARGLQKYGGASLSAPERNFELWQRSTIAMIDLIGDWPDYQSKLQPDFLDQLINDAISFERFFTGLQCVPNSPVVRQIATRQIRFANDVLTAIAEQLWKEFDNIVSRATVFEPATYKYEDFSDLAEAGFVSLFNRLRPAIPLTVNITPPYVGESLYAPPEIGELLPAFIKAAWCFGFVESVECVFTWSETGGASGGFDRLRDVHLYVNSTVLPGMKEKWRFPLLMRRVFTENAPILVWMGPPQSVKEMAYSQIKTLLTPVPAVGWPPANILQDEGLVLAEAESYFTPLVMQGIAELITAARRNVVEVDTKGRDAMRSLIGMYELLNQYVTFAGWESVKSSEQLDRLLFGSDSLVFIVSAIPLFQKIAVAEVRLAIEDYAERVVVALNDSISNRAPQSSALKITEQLRGLRTALETENRWSSDFAKRAVVNVHGDHVYSNSARSLSGTSAVERIIGSPEER